MSDPVGRRRLLGLGLVLALAACADDEPAPPQSFAPLQFGYLRPLRLNVATIRIDDGWAPAPGQVDLSVGAPVPPVAALRQMAQDRLVAAGSSGQAVFTIQDAEIRPQGDSLAGLFKVRVDIYASDGRRAAFAEAAVARSTTGPEQQSGMPAALYGLVRQMMGDMNVELEFQLRRSLGDWLVATAGTAPPPVAVQQQALPPPGTAATPLQPAGDQPLGATRYRLVPSVPPATPLN